MHVDIRVFCVYPLHLCPQWPDFLSNFRKLLVGNSWLCTDELKEDHTTNIWGLTLGFSSMRSTSWATHTLKNSMPKTSRKKTSRYHQKPKLPSSSSNRVFPKNPSFCHQKSAHIFVVFCVAVEVNSLNTLTWQKQEHLMRCHLQGYLSGGCQRTFLESLFCLKLAKLIRHAQLFWVICRKRHAVHAIDAGKTNTEHWQERFQTSKTSDLKWPGVTYVSNSLHTHVSKVRTMCGESEPRLDHPAHGPACRFCGAPRVFWRKYEVTKDSDGEGSLFGSQDHWQANMHVFHAHSSLWNNL